VSDGLLLAVQKIRLISCIFTMGCVLVTLVVQNSPPVLVWTKYLQEFNNFILFFCKYFLQLCFVEDSLINTSTGLHFTLKLRKLWTLKIFLECVFWPITCGTLWPRRANGFSVTESSCFERQQGLIFTSLSYRNWKCYSFLFESPTHYASENRFERFCLMKFFDKLTQRSVFPTFQILK